MARLNCFKISVKKYVARTNVVIFVFWKMGRTYVRNRGFTFGKSPVYVLRFASTQTNDPYNFKVATRKYSELRPDGQAFFDLYGRG